MVFQWFPWVFDVQVSSTERSLPRDDRLRQSGAWTSTRRAHFAQPIQSPLAGRGYIHHGRPGMVSSWGIIPLNGFWMFFASFLRWVNYDNLPRSWLMMCEKGTLSTTIPRRFKEIPPLTARRCWYFLLLPMWVTVFKGHHEISWAPRFWFFRFQEDIELSHIEPFMFSFCWAFCEEWGGQEDFLSHLMRWPDDRGSESDSQTPGVS